MSPKNCSLAYDIDMDFEEKIGHSVIEPNLRVITHKHLEENSSIDEIVFVKGRINVSF